MTARRGEPRDIKARALVLADGDTTVAIVVADSCMLPKDLVDGAKALAAERTGIPTDHMTISATHTHTAPSAMGALGTPADETYVPYLRLRLADAIAEAHGRLEPGRVGYASTSAAEFTALRRWIYRPDRVGTDPFGDATVRATMHAARDNLQNVTGESGPEDPELAVISVRTPDGRPLALLANFSMHYFGGGPAADYFGSYCDAIEKHHATPDRTPVAIMSHGCSGDIWRVDYRTGERQEPFEAFVTGMVDRTTATVAAIEEHRDADIAMAERRLKLACRVPDAARLAWARGIAAALEGKLPTTQPEIYALEQIALHERRTTDVVVQAIRIGDIAITTTPTETFALTGLKLKRQSPSTRCPARSPAMPERAIEMPYSRTASCSGATVRPARISPPDRPSTAPPTSPAAGCVDDCPSAIATSPSASGAGTASPEKLARRSAGSSRVTDRTARRPWACTWA